MISQLSFEVLNTLDSRFKKVTIPQLSEITDVVEEHICIFIQERITLNLKAKQSDSGIIANSEASYAVRFVEDALDETCLFITLQPLGVRISKEGFDTYEHKTNTVGRYKKITYLHPRTAPVGELNFEAIVTIFETCYAWLLEKLRTAIKLSETELEIAAISAVRRSLEINDKGHFAKQVLFVMTDRENVFYGFDTLTGETLINMAVNQASHTNQSPAKIVAEVLSVVMPREKSFSHQALKEGQKIEMNVERGVSLTCKKDHTLSPTKMYP